MNALLVLLQDNPAATTGFIAGIVGAIVVELVTWRWTIRRRTHKED